MAPPEQRQRRKDSQRRLPASPTSDRRRAGSPASPILDRRRAGSVSPRRMVHGAVAGTAAASVMPATDRGLARRRAVLEAAEQGTGKEIHARAAKEYWSRLEGLGLLDRAADAATSAAEANTPDSKVFYLKMRADHLRYVAEFIEMGNASTPAPESEETEATDAIAVAADAARSAYEEACRIAEKSLPAAHPVRLGTALNAAIFQHEVLQNPDLAACTARSATDAAEAEVKQGILVLPEAIYLTQLLRDTLALWEAHEEQASACGE